MISALVSNDCGVALPVIGILEQAQDRPALRKAVNLEFPAIISPDEHRRQMPGVDIVERLSSALVVAPEQARKPLDRCSRAQKLIEPSRSRLVLGAAAHPSAGAHCPKEQADDYRRRQSLPGDVAQHERDPALVV